MSKRVPLSERREQDKRGVDKVFFDSPVPPKAAPAKKAKPAPTPKAAQEESVLVKATYYIRNGQDDLLVDVQRAVKKQSGEKRDKSDLIREAIDLLAKKYGI